MVVCAAVQVRQAVADALVQVFQRIGLDNTLARSAELACRLSTAADLWRDAVFVVARSFACDGVSHAGEIRVVHLLCYVSTLGAEQIAHAGVLRLIPACDRVIKRHGGLAHCGAAKAVCCVYTSICRWRLQVGLHAANGAVLRAIQARIGVAFVVLGRLLTIQTLSLRHDADFAIKASQIRFNPVPRVVFCLARAAAAANLAHNLHSITVATLRKP